MLILSLYKSVGWRFYLIGLSFSPRVFKDFMYKVVLKGGSPWGFRLEDGTVVPGKTDGPVHVAKVCVRFPESLSIS